MGFRGRRVIQTESENRRQIYNTNLRNHRLNFSENVRNMSFRMIFPIFLVEIEWNENIRNICWFVGVVVVLLLTLCVFVCCLLLSRRRSEIVYGELNSPHSNHYTWFMFSLVRSTSICDYSHLILIPSLSLASFLSLFLSLAPFCMFFGLHTDRSHSNAHAIGAAHSAIYFCLLVLKLTCSTRLPSAYPFSARIAIIASS